MSKYLTRKRREQLKQLFRIDGAGYMYGFNRDNAIRLTFNDLGNIHDFLVFMGTEEYNLWMKKQVEKNNDKDNSV